MEEEISFERRAIDTIGVAISSIYNETIFNAAKEAGISLGSDHAVDYNIFAEAFPSFIEGLNAMIETAKRKMIYAAVWNSNNGCIRHGIPVDARIAELEATFSNAEKARFEDEFAEAERIHEKRHKAMAEVMKAILGDGGDEADDTTPSHII